MTQLSGVLLEQLRHDADARDVILRTTIRERLAASPAPKMDDHVVATYFLCLRTQTLERAAVEIAYHATSGIRNPPAGSLLEECTAFQVGADAWDASGKIGLLHVAFPLKMLLNASGTLTSRDLLHTAGSAVIFDMYENQDARLVALEIPLKVLKTFPGPSHGPARLRLRTGFGPEQPAFGTILKPTAGITAEDVGRIVGEVAGSPLLMFIKEDENLYPRLDYAPLSQRVRLAREAIERVREQRQGLGLVFAPHITGSPDQIVENAHVALEAGADGVMFSETFAGGAVRMVRDATAALNPQPVIYGHNAGIGVLTRGGIFREVIDFLARLDGIDFRQTAPVRDGDPFIRPFGAEWEASEHALTRPIPGTTIAPTMITRAGGLDQGNILLNLEDARKRGKLTEILLLAGSAINSIKNAQGRYDAAVGLTSIRQLMELYHENAVSLVPEEHLPSLVAVAKNRHMKELISALKQRYPGTVAGD